ncbi:coproporphyrinogen-III oxidase family protein [Actinocrispum sp. NPDC049592]|uniref:coproporphyrinogen-III oxidase family protein n=1 Tax=Actinocrispum sp. NPDC049592 TaxID=3154835 RepID=UPI0034200AF8
MRLLAKRTGLLGHLIARQDHADYVYMYPPRQAYRPFDRGTNLPGLISRSLHRFDDLNLYVHVPFCRQICRFCNLYAVGAAHNDLDGYVDAVIAEAQQYAGLTDRKAIATLYLGGGTPSLLAPAQLELLVTKLLGLFAVNPGDFPEETALEVDPATVDSVKLRDIKASGINRINLGYQSMAGDEVRHLGRDRPDSAGLTLLEDALRTGFANVCVDLIYGLDGQTDESWQRSVEQVAAVGPPTICAYSLTLRPFTGYSRRGYSTIDGATLYRRYELADQILRDAGYRQETHVRWVRDGGGYVQKVNHWGMRNVLGLGAGARSYLWNLDFRNGYSVRSRKSTLADYHRHVGEGRSPITDGYVMTARERVHKLTALNLMSLDRAWCRTLTGYDPVEEFADEFREFADLGLCAVNPDRVTLTKAGVRYRDLMSQTLFSEEVATRINEFSYDE